MVQSQLLTFSVKLTVLQHKVFHGVDNAAILWNVFGSEEADTSTPCIHQKSLNQDSIITSDMDWGER